MFQEEIARLTGKLVFQVDNRPLATFEKKLGGVLTMLRELSTLANKKFVVKVSLDSRSLRGQIEKATKTKISLTNIDVSNEALAVQGKKIQTYLDNTPIRLTNIKIDVSKLIEQKRFVKTLMGQMDLKLPVKLDLMNLERELRTEIAAIGKRQKITVEGNLNVTQFIIKLRRALKQAEKNMGGLKLRIHDPQVRLKVDKQHLIEEIKAAIASSEFRIRINARDEDFGGGRRGSRGRGGRSQAERGLSAAAGFARGALPGLGAAFAFSQMNDISQKVIAATNSLEAVSGSQENFKSNKNFIDNLAREQGLNFRDVAPQFSSIYQAAAPAIGVKGVQDMFKGITQYGTTHGLSKDAMKGSLVALGQMFGKDKIQAEEARQQFAERMPGGMAMLAQAAGNAGQTKNGTVAEFSDLMQKGKADPKKILPELGRLMKEASEKNDAYRKSLETTRVAQGRMNNAFEQSVMVFSKGGFDKGMGSFFNTSADSMFRAAPLIEALGKAFEILIKPVNALIRIFGYLGENWGKFADKLGMTKNTLATLAAGIAIFMLPFGGFITAIGAAALAIDDLLTYMDGGKSVFGQFVKDTPGAQEAVDNIAKSFNGIVDMLGQLMEKLGPVGEAFKGLTLNDVFLKALQTVDTQLQNILKTMQLIQSIFNGDAAGADAAASGINLLGGKTTYQRLKEAGYIGGGETSSEGGTSWFSGLGDSLSGIGDWLTGPASQRQTLAQRLMSGGDQMPATYTGQVDRTTPQLAPVNTGPISLTIEVKAPDGVSDPVKFAQDMAPHFETIMADAANKLFGEARAQQAERQ